MTAPPQLSVGSPLLVPFDGSVPAEAVLPFVPLLVDGQREVILLQVVPEPHDLRGPRGELMVSADEMRRASRSAAEADLRRAEAALAVFDAHLRIGRVVAIGEPAERIVEVAVERGARTILLASQGMSATGRDAFGSVVSRVVRTAPLPVVVVKPGSAMPQAGSIARLVVAYDGSDRAAQALPPVQALALKCSAPVHVIAVVEDEESAMPAAVAAAIAPQLREEARADARNVAQQRVEAIGAGLLRQGLRASWEVRRGMAARAIMDALAPQDLLVITPHGQTGGGWTLGSIAEKLVRESPAPVLLVRSERDRETDIAL